MTTLISNKRCTNSDFVVPPQKHPKLGSSAFLLLPLEVRNKIYSYLCPTDLLRLEASAKQISSETSPIWKKLRQAHHFQFDWAACEKEQWKEKWNYVLGAAFVYYINKRSRDFSHRNTQFTEQITRNFSGIMQRFPTFGQAISTDLKPEKSEVLINDTKVQRGGGEYLLLILKNCIESTDSTQLANNLNLAMKEKATCATLLALQAKPNWQSTNELQTILIKPCCKASKLGDHRSLRFLLPYLHDEEVRKLYNDEAHQYPPIIHHMAIIEHRSGNKQLEIEYCTKALNAYGENIPADLYWDAATAQFQIENYQQAASLYNKALNAYGANIPADLYWDAAIAQTKLKNYQQAESLFNKAINAYKVNIPATLYWNAGIAQLHLEKYKQAESLFNKAINAYRVNIPATLYRDAGIAQFRLKKYQQTANYLNQALDISTTQHNDLSHEQLSSVKNLLSIIQKGRANPSP